MKVCLILEGCYPYTRGGVSSWTHEFIKSNKDIEFIIWSVQASKSDIQHVFYKIPDNVSDIINVFLDEAYTHKNKYCSPNYINYNMIKKITDITENRLIEWDSFFNIFEDIKVNENLFSSEKFLICAEKIAEESSGKIGLSDAFYSLQSILMPISFILKQEIPQADMYHSAVAGYGGIMGAYAKYKTNKPFILTEHGIYPREREEELLMADWVPDSMRQAWIRSFYNLSRCAYFFADKVTTLFKRSSDIQKSLGCNDLKCSIIANGINVEKFSAIPMKTQNKEINIGAFIRFSTIKDIKTMIYAFFNLHMQVPHAHLYIMGGTDDEIYKEECISLIERLALKNIHIEGYVNTVEYMKKIDFTVMSSISEGQPLAILESLASGRPCIATNVGSCAELLLSREDSFGDAGFIFTPMNVEQFTNYMKILCIDDNLRYQMGQNGKKRVNALYSLNKMNTDYRKLYDEVVNCGRYRI